MRLSRSLQSSASAQENLKYERRPLGTVASMLDRSLEPPANGAQFLHQRDHEKVVRPTEARVADRIVTLLLQEGVTHIYGVPGGAIAPIYDALLDRPEFRIVHVRHEASALFMATGHAQLCPDSLPCVLVTSGPGVTNLITGLASAFLERTPVLVLHCFKPTF